MKFTVLGSGTANPDAARGPAGFAVQSAKGVWLIDGGSGTVQRCARYGIDVLDLNGGFYSHLHPDHCADLISLCFAMRVSRPRRTSDYRIWGPLGMRNHVAKLKDVWGHHMKPGAGKLVLQEAHAEKTSMFQHLDLQIEMRPAHHTPGALHMAFQSGPHRVVYSGDTSPSEQLVEMTRGADLLICECAGSDERPIPGHMTPSDVADLVEAATPTQVWLTHLYPHVDPEKALQRVRSTGVYARRASDGDMWCSSTPTQW